MYLLESTNNQYIAQTQNQIQSTTKEKVIVGSKMIWWLVNIVILSKYPIGFCYRIDQLNINGEPRGIKRSYGLRIAYLTYCFQVQS